MQSEFTAPLQKGCRKSLKDSPCGCSTTEKARPAPSAEHISDTLLASEWRGKVTCKLQTWWITQEPMDKATKQQEQLRWLKACSVCITTSKTLEGFGRLDPSNQQITATALLSLLRRNASNRRHSLQSSPVQRSLHNSTVWLFEHDGALFSVAWDFPGNPLAWAKLCKCQTLVHPALRPPHYIDANMSFGCAEDKAICEHFASDLYCCRRKKCAPVFLWCGAMNNLMSHHPSWHDSSWVASGDNYW